MLTVIYSDEFLNHKTGLFHPERPERLTAIVNALKSVPWTEQLRWEQPTPVADRLKSLIKLLETVHTPAHIQQVKAISDRGGGYLDGDTPLSAESYDVALLAVSAWLDGVDRVLDSRRPAFVLARPPGHHAESDRGMGFCLLSNAAIAAYYALKKPGIQKVAILDWDVHHGNGTQELVEDNPRIAYCFFTSIPLLSGDGICG